MKTRVIGIVGIALSSLVLTGSAHGNADFAKGVQTLDGGVEVCFRANQISVGVVGYGLFNNPPLICSPGVGGQNDRQVVYSSAQSLRVAHGLSKTGTAIEAVTGTTAIPTTNIMIRSPGRFITGYVIDVFDPTTPDVPVLVTMFDGSRFTCCNPPNWATSHGHNYLQITTSTEPNEIGIISIAVDMPPGQTFARLRNTVLGGTTSFGAVPEPSSMLLMAGGVLGVTGILRRRLRGRHIEECEKS